MFSKDLRKQILDNIKKTKDGVIDRYFKNWETSLSEEILNSLEVKDYPSFFLNTPSFLSLKYCIYCGKRKKDNHTCEESTEAEKEILRTKMIPPEKKDSFEKLLERVEKFKNIDWDNDFKGMY